MDNVMLKKDKIFTYIYDMKMIVKIILSRSKQGKVKLYTRVNHLWQKRCWKNIFVEF